MGETAANAAYMYDEVEGIRNLNKVEEIGRAHV